MRDKNQKLIKLIQEQNKILIDNICSRLQNMTGSHYASIDFERHQDREQLMLEALVQGLAEENHQSFLNFVEQLAGKRSLEGYSLAEVLQAVDIFAQESWHLLARRQKPSRDLLEMLYEINQIFGQAKNLLATIFLRQAGGAQAELDRLKEKFFVYRHQRSGPADDDAY
jgi:hypothetical protein